MKHPTSSSRERGSPRSRGDAGRELLTCVFLVLAIAVVFFPLLRAGFVNYDDPDFVVANAAIQQGLGARSLQWAFQSMYIYWQPLTWLSYMVDHRLYGLNPAGFHLTNLVLHAANSLLLFLVLRRATAAYWRSLLVTLLFALHPLHVESVAWISERKGLLSAFFGFLALAAYLRYAQRPALRRYLLVLACFALGLMAKSMLVTLPGLLLLLDWWPLRRFPSPARTGFEPSQESAHHRPCPQRTLGALVWEKLPLLVLAGASGVLSVVAQRKADALVTLQSLPLTDRLANACFGYGWYLLRTVWPVDLSVFYPRPEHWPPGWLALAALSLILGSALAVLLLRRCPYAFVGWFWFLGTLVPVIGLVQIGDQAFADRYAYVPLIGLFILGVWSAGAIARVSAPARPVLAGLAAVLILVCASLTARQLRVWQGTATLFEHALAVNPDNPQACAMVGSLRAAAGRYDDAYRLFERALRLNPAQSDAHLSWGSALADQGQIEEAARHFAEAIRIKPAYVDAHLALGLALHRQAKPDQAIREFQQALQLKPDSAAAYNNLAMVLYAQGRKDDAITNLEAAVRFDPRLAAAHQNLAIALQSQGRTNEADLHFQAALEFTPHSAGAYLKLAGVLLDQGRLPDARIAFERALRLEPDAPAVLNNVAWILATHPSPEVRDGGEAVRLAEKACELTRSQEAVFVGTLAAAYAEAGRFEDALATAQKAHDLAIATKAQDLADTNLKLMELYRDRKPFHQETDPKP